MNTIDQPPTFYFPPEDFPLLIEALHPQGSQVVWCLLVTKPSPIYIPPLKLQLGHRVVMRCTFADGTSTVFP